MHRQQLIVLTFLGTAALAAAFVVPAVFEREEHDDAPAEKVATSTADVKEEVSAEEENVSPIEKDEQGRNPASGEMPDEERNDIQNLDIPNLDESAEDTSVYSLSNPLTRAECDTITQNSFFYWNPKSQVVREEATLRSAGNIESANLLRKISCRPQSAWLANPDAVAMRTLAEKLTVAAEKAGQVPVLTLYNGAQGNSILWRLGSEGEQYLDWMRAVADGIGERSAWIILEPDSIGMSGSYNAQDRAYRHNELKQAVRILKADRPNTRVYIDAANSGWWDADYVAELLSGADIFGADGFALNIANYHVLENEIKRGEEISEHLGGGIHFVIDTSRNGNGSEGGWCNLPDMAIGVPPTIETGHELIDAFIWIKPPGESDGQCNGGPPAGKFWLEYALSLVQNTTKSTTP